MVEEQKEKKTGELGQESEKELKEEKVSIFIDGSNLYHGLKKNSIETSFEDLIKALETRRKVVSIFYYAAKLDKDYNPEKYLEHQKFLEKIKTIPNFHVILCNLRKIILEDGSISYQIKGDDVNLAIDLVKGAYENLYDIAIIVSGDEDFLPAIELVQEKGKKVINAFFPKSSAYRLRTRCNGSINIKNLLIKKEKSQYGEP
jgi:uncharacterized LabA/DUF88 family protein